jgi:tetratricopeptide (TPR) repeat protein
MGAGTFGAAAVICASVIMAYANTLAVPFLLDDTSAVVNNASIRSLRRIGAVLAPSSTLSTGRRPLLNLSFAINYALGGEHVGGYHVFNLAMHVLSALVLFGLVRRTLARPGIAARFAARPTVIAAAIAALWALHPLQTEAVTYISQRAESMMGLLYLATLYGLVRSDSSPHGTRWLWFSAACCYLGMATKEVMVTAPVVALLFDRAFLAGTFRAAFSRRRGYYIALFLSWAWLACLFVRFGFHRSGVGFGSSLGTWYYVCTEAMVIVRYAGLVVWPAPLVFDYGPEIVVQGLVASLPFALPVIAAVVAAGLLWRKRPGLAFLASAFFILLAPTSTFVPVQGQPMAESRMYLPLAAALALSVLGLFRGLGSRAPAAILPIGLILIALTFARNLTYASDVRILGDSLAKCPVNSRGQNNLAVALLKDPARIADAVAHFEEAIRIAPQYAEAHCNLGTALVKIPGRQGEAIAHFKEALRLVPDYASAHINLGFALTEEGRNSEAIEQLEAAERLDPDVVVLHVNLGNALAKLPGMEEKAKAQYEEALRIDPDNASAYYNLGNLYARTPDRMEEAVAAYERALASDPAFVEAHVNLGNALTSRPGRLPDAIAQYEAALRLRPDLADAELNLANVLSVQAGGLPAAIEHYDRALRLQPDNAAARFRYGNALTAARRWGDAETQYRAAVRILPDFVDAHNDLANVLVVTKRIEEAKAEFETVLRLDPHRESARKTLNMISAPGFGG